MKKIILVIFVAILGCGSASNDQGVSFGAIRFCTDSTCDTGSSGAPFALDNDDDLLRTIELKNYLSKQFIQVKYLSMEYSVLGGNLPTQYDTFISSFRIDGAAVDEDGVVTPSVGTIEFPIVTRNIKQILSLNRNDLPDTAITMIVSVKATGVTASGKEYTTNALDFPVYITYDPDPIVGSN